MKISIFGLGYVGNVTALGLHSLGYDIVGIEIIEEKVKLLKSGKLPIFEPDLEPLLKSAIKDDRINSFVIQSKINILLERAYQEIKSEGFSDHRIRLEPALDMRYRGQSYELLVPLTKNIVKDFHESHRQTYGYLRPEADLEIVNLRVRAIGQVDSPNINAQPLMDSDPSGSLIDYRKIVMEGNIKTEVPFYHGETLNHGNMITGPAVVLRNDTTILIGQSDHARVDPFNNLIIEIGS